LLIPLNPQPICNPERVEGLASLNNNTMVHTMIYTKDTLPAREQAPWHNISSFMLL